MRLEAAGRPSEFAEEAAPPSPAGSRERISWYVRRLQRMSAQEVWWRASDAMRQRAWQLKQAPAMTTPRHLTRFVPDGYRVQPKLAQAPRFESPLPAGALDAVPADDVRRLVRTADEILAGRPPEPAPGPGPLVALAKASAC